MVRRKRGQATVELALVITLMVLLLVGVADVARIYGEQLAVVHAAGVGARWATLTPSQRAESFGNVCQAVAADLHDDLPSGAALNVVAADQGNQRVRVTVTYPHDFLFGLFQPGGMFVGLPSNYTTSATMPYVEGVIPATFNGTCTLP